MQSLDLQRRGIHPLGICRLLRDLLVEDHFLSWRQGQSCVLEHTEDPQSPLRQTLVVSG